MEHYTFFSLSFSVFPFFFLCQLPFLLLRVQGLSSLTMSDLFDALDLGEQFQHKDELTKTIY